MLTISLLLGTPAYVGDALNRSNGLSILVVMIQVQTQSTNGVGTFITIGALLFVTGYLVKLVLFPTIRWKKRHAAKKVIAKPTEDADTSEEDEEEYDEDSEDSLEINLTDLNSVPGEVRMVLVVRQDLKMGKGKAAAQCCHATLALYKKITNPNSAAFNPDMVKRWEWGNGQAKITLQVPNQEEMDILFAQAMSMGVNVTIVHDAGRTQIAAGSATVLGLGPATKAVLDEITGELKLY